MWALWLRHIRVLTPAWLSTMFDQLALYKSLSLCQKQQYNHSGHMLCLAPHSDIHDAMWSHYCLSLLIFAQGCTIMKVEGKHSSQLLFLETLIMPDVSLMDDLHFYECFVAITNGAGCRRQSLPAWQFSHSVVMLDWYLVSSIDFTHRSGL